MKRPPRFFGNRGDIERLKMAPEVPRGPDVAWERLKGRVGKREFRYGNALVAPLYPDISGRGSWQYSLISKTNSLMRPASVPGANAGLVSN